MAKRKVKRGKYWPYESRKEAEAKAARLPLLKPIDFGKIKQTVAPEEETIEVIGKTQLSVYVYSAMKHAGQCAKTAASLWGMGE